MARNAYNYALNLLSARAYTTRNLRRKLVQKEFDATEVEAAMERLISSGLLDDSRYAAEYARQKLVHGGASVRRVEQDLARKGVARDLAKRAAASVMDEEAIDASAAVLKAARKKLASMGDLEPVVKRRRVFAFLARRGFELAEIDAAIKAISRVLL